MEKKKTKSKRRTRNRQKKGREREQKFLPLAFAFPRVHTLSSFGSPSLLISNTMTESASGPLKRRVHHPATGSLTPSLFIAVATIAR